MAGRRRGEMTVRVGADTRGYRKEVGKLKGFSKKAGKGMALALGAATVGVGAIAAGVGVLTKKYLDQGDALDKMSKRTGVSVEQLQKLDFAAQQSGTSIETMEKGFKRQAAFLNEARKGTKTYTDTLDQLGIGVEAFEKLSPDQAFHVLAEEISNLRDPMEQAAVAQLVFGRAGTEMLPLLQGGADGIRELTAQAEASGNIMSTEAAEAAAQFNDRLNVLKQQVLGLGQKAFGALIPLLLDGIAVLESWMPVIQRWWNDTLEPALEQLWGMIERNLLPALQQFWSWINGTLIPLFEHYWPIAMKVVTDFINDVLVPLWENDVKPAVDAFLQFVETQVQPRFEQFVGFLEDRLDFVQLVFEKVWAAIQIIIDTAFDAFRASFHVFAALFKGDWQGAWESLKIVLARIWEGIKQVLVLGLDVLKGLWHEFREVFDEEMRTIKTKVMRTWNQIWDGIKGIINGIIGSIEALPNSFIGAINGMIHAWNRLEFRFPSIQLPSVTLGGGTFLGKKIPSKTIGGQRLGGVTFSTPDIDLIPPVFLPRLAKGGIVSSPTVALIGESGPEAVIPLRGRGGLGSTINLHFHGDVYAGSTQELADTVIAALEQWRRRNGRLPAVLTGA